MFIASRFFVEKVLGVGGMGKVYLAHDNATGRKVAVKVVTPPNERARERFVKEVDLLSRIRHDNVVEFIGSGFDEAGGLYWCAMEYVSGVPLIEWFANSQFSFDLFTKIFIDIADALSELNSLSIVHRDLKPDNILIDEGKPVLVDFSIAFDCARGARIARQDALVGTVAYMSPEHVIGYTLDIRSDLYSLGMLMYEVLTGENPFEGLGLSNQVQKILNEPLPRPGVKNPDISPFIEKIVMKLLEKNPEDRFQTPEELKKELVRCNKNGELQDLWNPTPLRDEGIARVPFVGRSAEFERVLRSLSQIGLGKGQIIEILGSKGFGKSRMLDEIKIEVLAQGGRYFSCKPRDEYLARPAVGYLLDCLAESELQMDTKSWDNHANFIRDLSPKFAAKLEIPAKESRLFEQVDCSDFICDILLSVLPDIPAVFAFDEPMDKLTIDVVNKLTKKIKNRKTLVCVTGESNILDLSEVSPYVTKIELGCLSKADIFAMAESFLKRPPEEGELNWIERLSNGEPQRIVRLLDILKTGADSVIIDDTEDSLKQHYTLILDGVSREAALILNILAVVGRPVNYKFLRPVSRLFNYEFEQTIKNLQLSGLIKEEMHDGVILVESATSHLQEVVLDRLDDMRHAKIAADVASTLELQSNGCQDTDLNITIARQYLKSGNHNKAAYFYDKISAFIMHHEKALKILSEIEPFLDLVTDVNVYCRLLCRLKELYFNLGDTEKNLLLTKRILRDIKKGAIPGGLLPSVYASLFTFSFIDDCEGMDLESLREAERYFDKVEDRSLKTRFLSVKARYLMQLDRHEEAEECLFAYLDLVDKEDNPLMYMRGLSMFATVQCSLGNHDIGLNYFEKALQYVVKCPTKKEEIDLLAQVATTQFHMGKYREASKTCEKALNLTDDCDTDSLPTQLLLIYAHAIRDVGEFDKYQKHLLYLNELIYKVPLDKYVIGWVELLLDHHCLSGCSQLAVDLVEFVKQKCLELSNERWFVKVLMCELELHNYIEDKSELAKLVNRLQKFFPAPDKTSRRLFDAKMFTKLATVNINGNEMVKARRNLDRVTELVQNLNDDDATIELLDAEIYYLRMFHSNGHKTRIFGVKHDYSKWKLTVSKVNSAISILLMSELKYAEKRIRVTENVIALTRDRIAQDDNLDAFEKRRLYNFAVEQMESLFGFYRKTGYTYRKENILEINNSLSLLVK